MLFLVIEVLKTTLYHLTGNVKLNYYESHKLYTYPLNKSTNVVNH